MIEMMTEKIEAKWYAYDLNFKHTFTVAQYSRNSTPIVILSLIYKGLTGYGEACMPPYLGESTESVFEFLNKVNFEQFTPDLSIASFLEDVDALSENNTAAKAAVDIALHDLVSKLKKQTALQFLNIPSVKRLSSYTIGLDNIDKMVEKTIEAKALGFKVLKIKIGTDNDIELVNAILEHWKQPFSVDVNQGWSSLDYAKKVVTYLKEKGALFVEQPFHKDALALTKELKELNILPIIADESIKRLVDLEKRYSYFDGVNIKLMKSTGLHEAQKMIAFAKSKNLKIVIGCMAESSCAATAASNLIHFADWVDIDAPYLITNDPFEGIKIVNGEIIQGDNLGIGLNALL